MTQPQQRERSSNEDGIIVAYTSPKGGVSKSTLSRNTTVHASYKHRILIADLDPQGTSGKFYQRRLTKQSDKPYFDYVNLKSYQDLPLLREQKKNFDYIFLDVAGKADADFKASLIYSDVALLPFEPSPDSTDVLDFVLETLEQVRQAEVNPHLKAYSFLSRVNRQSKLGGLAKEILQKEDTITFLDIPIYERTAYVWGVLEGQGIFEVRPKPIRACHDFGKFYNTIMIELENQRTKLNLINRATA